MKKIILIFIIFLLTGCYDYLELNDLSFISAIAIDYVNNEYEVSFEILNDNKNGDGGIMNESYVISSKGLNISDAFDNISIVINKVPYFYHLNTVVISENIEGIKMKETFDYILRNPEIKNEFYLVLAKNVSPKDIISNSSKENLVVGEQIVKMIKSNTYQSFLTYDKNFEDNMEIVLDKYLSLPINTFTLNENNLDIEGLAIYKDYKRINYLTKDESLIFNYLNNKDCNFTLSNHYNDDLISINIYLSKTNIKLKNHLIEIDTNAFAELKNNTTSFNLKEEKTYNKLNNDFEIILQEKIEELFNTLKVNQTDILKINNLYYRKEKNKKDIFSEYNIKINTKLVIDKKGLIFNLNHE